MGFDKRKVGRNIKRQQEFYKDNQSEIYLQQNEHINTLTAKLNQRGFLNHIKRYWFFYLYGLIVLVGIIALIIFNHLAGNPNASFWRFQK